LPVRSGQRVRFTGVTVPSDSTPRNTLGRGTRRIPDGHPDPRHRRLAEPQALNEKWVEIEGLISGQSLSDANTCGSTLSRKGFRSRASSGSGAAVPSHNSRAPASGYAACSLTSRSPRRDSRFPIFCALTGACRDLGHGVSFSRHSVAGAGTRHSDSDCRL
jgi:hypothetical protein